MWTWAGQLKLERHKYLIVVLKSMSGLTILEIALSIFLSIMMLLGWISIFRRHHAAKETLACTSHKWSWLFTMDTMAWEVQKWEVMAGQCLNVGYNPLRRTQESKAIELDVIRTARLNFRSASAPNILIVPPSSEFMAGDRIVVCTPRIAFRATIQRIEVDSNRNVLYVSYDPPLNELIPAGSIVASVSSVTYSSEPSLNPPEKILYRGETQANRKPIALGFDRFDIQLSSDEWHHLRGNIQFGLGSCEASLPLHLKPALIDEDVGRWWIRGSNLVFEPWKIQEGMGP